MIDAFAYTSERVPPVRGPRKPEDRKPKRRKGATGGTLKPGYYPGPGGSGVIVAPRRPRGALPPGTAIMVSPGILAELNAILPPSPHYPMLNMGTFSPNRGIADAYYSGYPIVSSGILA